MVTRRTKENWLHHTWRPIMAWQYTIICLFDFMIAPIMSWLFSYYTNTPVVPWQPLTLTGAAMYHVSMGAIVGVTAFGRSKEKIAEVEKL